VSGIRNKVIVITGASSGIGEATAIHLAQQGGSLVLGARRLGHLRHFINLISTAGLKIVPTMAVCAATKNAVRTLTEGLRQEAGPKLRVTGISPGFVRTNLVDSMTVQKARDLITAQMNEIAISPEAIARAVAFAIEQPDDVDVGDIVVRPTAQG
jgi:NADP-dependent 3-hydroxy acid dehydrogenase YdfG